MMPEFRDFRRLLILSFFLSTLGALGYSATLQELEQLAGDTPKLWLDASDEASVTENGGAVSQWADKSGNGNDYSQATAGNQPQLVADAINGNPGVKFDGVDDYLWAATRLGLGANPDIMVFMVTVVDADVQNDSRLLHIGNTPLTLAVGGGAEGWAWRYDGGNERYSTVSKDKAAIQVWERGAGADFQAAKFYLDGTELSRTGGVNDTLLPEDTKANSSIGGKYLGSGSPRNQFSGKIGEIILLELVDLNARQKVEGYLAHKWGLTESLPDGHPHKANDVPEIGGVVILEGNENETFSIFSPGQVSTLAGTGVAGEADGAGNVATFNAPIGLAVDSQGNVIVVDHLNDKIRKIAPDGTVSSLAGNGVAATVDGNGLNAGFDRPTGITLDPFDTIFLVEGNGTVVRKITPSGDATTIAGKIHDPGFVNGNATSAMFGYPYDVVLDEVSNVIYLTDVTNHAIRKVDLNLDPTDTNFVSTLAGNGAAGFADGNGAAAQFNEPLGLDIDSAGNLYVADAQNHRIRKITPSGEVTTLAGTGVQGFEDGGVISAQFNTPRGIVVYNDSTLFVAEYYGNVIREIDLASNTVTKLFGDGTASDVDGSLDLATTKNPSALAAHEGSLYLSSFDGHTVRQILLPSHLHVFDPDSETLTVNLEVANGLLSVTLAEGTSITEGSNGSTSMSIQGTEEDVNDTLATLQFTPTANYNGDTTLTASVSDGTITSEKTSIGVTVQSINDVPEATDLMTSTPRNTALNVNLSVSDPDEDQLNFIIVTNPSNGSLSGTAPNLTYTPANNFIGLDSFTYKANDGQVDSETVTVSINVYHPVMNWVQWVHPGSYPNFNPDLGYTYATATTGQVSLPDGSLIQVTFAGEIVEAGSAFGTLNNSFWADTNYNGNTYVSENVPELPTNSDRLGLSGKAVAVQTLTFSHPVTNLVMNLWSLGSPTVPGSYQFDQPFVVLSQSTQYNVFTVNESAITGLEGSGTIQFNGTFSSLSWVVPAAEFYSVWNVGVTANPAPDEEDSTIAGDVSGEGNEDLIIAGTLSATDPQGLTDGTYFTISEPPVNGSATINPESGAWVYTPDANYFGEDAFTVTVTDDLGRTTNQVISITINRVNDAPVLAEIGAQGTPLNTPIVLTISATDVDNDTLSYSVEESTNITATLEETTLTLTPANGWTGAESVTVKVNDGDGGSDSETVEVSVSRVPTISGIEEVHGLSGSSTPLFHERALITNIAALFGSGKQGLADGVGDLAQFSFPSAIDLDSTGNLFVADYDNNRIRKVTPEGTVTQFAGDGKAATSDGEGVAAQFNRPSGIAIDLNDNVYVVEHAGHVIRKISPTGAVTTLAGAAGVSGNINGAANTARFSRPFGLAIHPSSPILYISEWGNHAIRMINLSLDPSDTNFVTTLAGSGSSEFVDGTGESAHFNYPYGMAVDTSGNLYVADHWNHRIRKITSTGVVSTLAGNGEAGNLDGTGISAQIGQPWAVTLQDEGTLLVSTSSRTLRSIDIFAGNEVSTILDDAVDVGFSIPIGRVSSILNVEGSLYLASLTSHNILTLTQGASTLSVSDQDSEILLVTLSVENGILTVPEGLVGTTTVIEGAINTGTITLKGIATDLNDTLSNLHYVSNQDFSGIDVLTLRVSDGVTTPSQATSLSINVAGLVERQDF